jgi:hypothetical protein
MASTNPSVRTLGAHVVATEANGLFRLTCNDCSGWWTTATDLGDAWAAAEDHDADHARWADQDARR